MNEKQLCPLAMMGGKSVECAHRCRTCLAEDVGQIAEGLFAVRNTMFDVFGSKEAGDALRGLENLPVYVGSIADAICNLEVSDEVE